MTNFKKLSFWAKNHKWSSRFIIIVSFIIMNILGLATGFLLDKFKIILPAIILIGLVSVFVIAFVSYPEKITGTGNIEKYLLYGVRKAYDAVLIGLTFLMFVYFGNHQTSPLNYFISELSASSAIFTPRDSSKTYRSIEEFRQMMKDKDGKSLKWKERKKLLKQQVKEIKKDKSISTAGKILLILLCVAIALFLTYVVAALACSLSCSGAEGAAVVVAVFGFGGVIVLTFFMIRGIIRRSQREKEKKLRQPDPAGAN